MIPNSPEWARLTEIALHGPKPGAYEADEEFIRQAEEAVSAARLRLLGTLRAVSPSHARMTKR
jgi:hypothetical protein